MSPKPSFCSQCPISGVTSGYVPLQRGSGRTLLVGEASGETEALKGLPFQGGAGSWLNNILRAAGINRSELNVINTIGCQPPNNIYPTDHKWTATSRADGRSAVQYCYDHHLRPAIQALEPGRIIALGDQALTALTGRRGILVWRGSQLPYKELQTISVLPTLHPAYLMRDAKFTSVAIKDLRKPQGLPPEFYNLYANPIDLAAWRSQAFAFDFEWDRTGSITLCGLSARLYSAEVAGFAGENLRELRRIFESSTDLIGHNIIGADTTYFERLGWRVSARMHDTMLKQHLVQPDYRHSLAFVASVLTNKVFWKGRGKEKEDEDGNIIDTKEQWKTWRFADAIPRHLGGFGGCTSDDEAYRLYNARDTDASFQVNGPLDTLLDRYGLTSIYWNVSLPLAYIVRDMGGAGLRVDSSKVAAIRQELGEEIANVEERLPEGLRPYDVPTTRQIPAPPDTYKPRQKLCKGLGKRKHAPVEFTFYKPGDRAECECGRVLEAGKLALVKRIKVPSSKRIVPWNSSAQVMSYAKRLKCAERVDRKRGTASADVNSRKLWGRKHPEFRLVDRLKDLSTERNTFAKEGYALIDRLHPQYNVHGTATGRLSSHEPNIQNQPKSIRKIYVPDQPDWCFIELDYASGENMLTAYLAEDWPRLERLRQPGYSEHLDLTRKTFNLPNLGKTEAEEYGPEKLNLYDICKHINHGSNYGMTHVKLKEYMEVNGFFYSEAECKKFMQAGKELNPGTAAWQERTTALARRDGYLRNAFGRMRWFSSRSIATESLAFLPSSTLADIILRAMIAHYPARFAGELAALGVGVQGELMPGWKLSIQVHDSLVLQGPAEHWQAQAERTRAIMCQPWQELQGFALDVETKSGPAGASWGELKKI